MSGGSVPAATWMGTMKPLKEGTEDTLLPAGLPAYLHGSASTQVPDVIGRNVDEAKAQLDRGRLHGATSRRSSSAGTAVNIVVDQNPKSTALPGGAITLVDLRRRCVARAWTAVDHDVSRFGAAPLTAASRTS